MTGDGLRPLGRSGALVGPLSFGGAPLGNLLREVSDEVAEATVDAAWAAGIRYFDTAPFYGIGLAEQRLGAALRRYPREEYLLSSKVGRLLEPNPEGETDDPFGFVVRSSLRRRDTYGYDDALRSVEESLERLGADRLDIVYVHDPDERMDEAVPGAFAALARLREEGVIRSFGAGANRADTLARVIERTDADVVLSARRLSLGDRSATEELVPLAEERGVSIVAAGVIFGGPPERNVDPAAPAESDPPAVRRARELCAAHGVPLLDVMLQLPRRFAPVATVLVGMRSPVEVGDDLLAVGREVPDELWAELGLA